MKGPDGDVAMRGSGIQPMVSLRHVGKVFDAGQANETVAVHDLSLEVHSGEFLSLIGPSGCGKSTVLRLIGDLIAPTSGAVRVNGKTAHQARLDQDYGIVFQSPVLFEWRRVVDNVRLPLELRGLSRAEQDRRAAELLTLVELGGFERHYPGQLSGGMQQRAAIARALATGPGLLLMDEPFGALDALTRERLNMELHTIWQHTGTTVLFVTHSIAEAAYLSTRVAVMSARPGRIAAVVDIDLPVPRTDLVRSQTRYFELVNTVRQALHQAGDPAA
jgi:NitT/TauT family transport system ATP-binding protein